MADNPRAVVAATLEGARANFGRRESVAMTLSPGLVMG
jgi:hypothetical protein